MSETQETQILLVEDDDIDAMAFRRHVGSADINATIHRAIDGTEALAMLRGSGETPPLAWPFIIVLDLNMPRMNGLEFIQELRADERLRRCVVIVFTTSNALKDRLPCFEHHVAAYVLKSRAGEKFCHLTALLECYLNLSELPPNPNEDIDA